ncbi:MAG: shikimate dehydrogenase [Candidatus Zhuqueibacterota bacterium]
MNRSRYTCLVIGNPISHSLSPHLHAMFFRRFGIDGEYRAQQVKPDELAGALASFRKSGITGVNVTAPLKNDVLPFMDTLTAEAELIGSVNTIAFGDDAVIGHNTDAIGFQASLRHWGISLAGKNVLLFGAGGAARAVLFALIREKCRAISIANRTGEKAEALASAMSVHASGIPIDIVPFEPEAIGETLKISQVVINSTTVGMAHQPASAILSDDEALSNDMFIYDLIYRPCETPLLQQAKRRNIQHTNGLGMLIFQGFESFKFWTNQQVVLTESLYNDIEMSLRREICQE